MTSEDYLNIRETSIILSEKIFNWGERKFSVESAGKAMGLFKNNTLVMEDESDSDDIQEFMMYHSMYMGKRVLDLFYDSDIELDDTEEEILDGMVNSEMSIFEILSIDNDHKKCRLTLFDLINNKIYEIINIGFSQTTNVGMILCTRMVRISDNFHMASGSTFIFDKTTKDKLLSDYSFEKLKLRRNLNSEKLFLLTYKKSKLYGRKVKSFNYNEL